MPDQTDLLAGLETQTADDPPPWRELHIGERRYRWRMLWEEVDRTHWRPEDRVGTMEPSTPEEELPYRPPGPAFDLEFFTPGVGWRTVRYFDRRVEVWGVVRGEAMG